jgi:hypothetical protein
MQGMIYQYQQIPQGLDDYLYHILQMFLFGSLSEVELVSGKNVVIEPVRLLFFF